MKPDIKNKHLFFAITIIFVLSFTGYFYYSSPPSIFWKQDAGQMYEISSNTFFHMPHQAERLSVRGGIEMKGILNFRIFDVNNDNIRAGFQIFPVHVRYKGVQNKNLEELYSHLFYITFSHDGRITGFDFSNRISFEDEEILKNFTRNLQVVIPGTLLKSWATEETDIYGLYSAEYSFKEKLIKSKEYYIDFFDIKGFEGHFESADIMKSEITADYGYPDIWIKSLKGQSLTAFYDGRGDMLVKFSSGISLKKIPYSPDRDIAIWNDDRNPDAEISAWSNNPKETVSIAHRNELKRLKSYFGNISLPEFAESQFKKHIKFSASCVNEFLYYLQLHPEAASEIADYLLKKGLNKDQRAMLINVLQGEQGITAQQTLLKILKGDEFPPDSRIQSAMALGDMKKPDSSIIGNLWETYKDRDIENDINRKVANTSLLSLGRISRRMLEDKSEENKQMASEIKSRIESELSSVNDVSSRCAMIRAAANTGDSEFIEPISDCFQSDIPAIRSAAAHSLTGYSGDEIDSILAHELGKDDNPGVRSSLVASMRNRNAGDESVEKICEEIQHEENDIVRGEMYRFLLKYRKRHGVKETLQKMQKTENTMENRRLISRALATRK